MLQKNPSDNAALQKQSSASLREGEAPACPSAAGEVSGGECPPAGDGTPKAPGPPPSAEAAGESPPPTASPAPDPMAVLVAEAARLAEELRQANDRALRSQAELENFRKRMRREMEEERRYASLPLILDLLDVLDNLQRAIEASEQNENASGLREGVKMVAAQLAGLLDKYHCRPLDAVGSAFDPHLHEAVCQEPSDQYAAGFITRVVRTGYRMHDRVVRPSQVFVSAGPAAAPESPTGPETRCGTPDREPSILQENNDAHV